MDLNREEFLDILMLARHMAMADGEMHPNEKKVLVALFNSIGVTPEEQEKLRSKSSIGALMKEVQSEEARLALVDVLALVAGADGKFEDEEKHFIFRVMKKLNMDPNDHPYFEGGTNLDMKKIRSNINAIINKIKQLSH